MHLFILPAAVALRARSAARHRQTRSEQEEDGAHNENVNEWDKPRGVKFTGARGSIT